MRLATFAAVARVLAGLGLTAGRLAGPRAAPEAAACLKLPRFSVDTDQVAPIGRTWTVGATGSFRAALDAAGNGDVTTPETDTPFIADDPVAITRDDVAPERHAAVWPTLGQEGGPGRERGVRLDADLGCSSEEPGVTTAAPSREAADDRRARADIDPPRPVPRREDEGSARKASGPDALCGYLPGTIVFNIVFLDETAPRSAADHPDGSFFLGSAGWVSSIPPVTSTSWRLRARSDDT
jgi:hypothetical protein